MGGFPVDELVHVQADPLTKHHSHSSAAEDRRPTADWKTLKSGSVAGRFEAMPAEIAIC